MGRANAAARAIAAGVITRCWQGQMERSSRRARITVRLRENGFGIGAWESPLGAPRFERCILRQCDSQPCGPPGFPGDVSFDVELIGEDGGLTIANPVRPRRRIP